MIKLGAIYVIDLTQSTQIVVMIVLLIEEINLMQVSLEIVRLGTTRKKKKKSHEHGFKYIYIYTWGLLPDWERRKKKNRMPSSRIVLEIPELMLYAGKIMSYVWLELPFYIAGQREFNCN